MNQNDRFFEESYKTGTDAWSHLQERDEVLGRWIGSINDPPGLLLDIGCGVARHAKIVCKHGWRYVGIDKANECVEQAKQNINGLDAELVTGDVLAMSLGAKFDAVIDFACFTHLRIEAWPIYQAKLIEHIRPGSRFLLSVWSAESTGAYGVEFETGARECTVGYHGGVYTRLFTIENIKRIFGLVWKIESVKIVTLQQEPVIGLKHLFVGMQKRGESSVCV